MTDPNPAERLTPANVEAEQALLGAILVNNDAYYRVADFLEAEHFHEPLHRKLFEIIEKTIRAGRGINPVLIKPFLPVDGKIGEMSVAQYVAFLAAQAVTVINAREYGFGIHELWIRRKAIGLCEEAASLAYDLPVDADIMAELGSVEEGIAKLRAERLKEEGHSGAGESYLAALSAAYKQGEVKGVPICLPEIANVISEPCFEAGNLYGLLSSSGEGKTSLTIQLIVYALKKGNPVLFLSYDQSSDQVVRQMVAQEYGIEARRQRDAKLLSEREFETCMDFAAWIRQLPFELVKCTDQSAAQLAGYARTFLKRRSNGNVPLVVVDHIGSVTPDDRRADEGTKAKNINKVFKAAAESTGAPWLVLNQRNSYGMKRDNPRPISADLFGGDPAKQAYDAIFYLYRFKKFLEERKAIASTESDWKKIEKVFPSAVRQEGEDIAEIGALKIRFGSPYIKERLIFEAHLTRYKSEQEPQPQTELLQLEHL